MKGSDSGHEVGQAGQVVQPCLCCPFPQVPRAGCHLWQSDTTFGLLRAVNSASSRHHIKANKQQQLAELSYHILFSG